MVRWRFVTSGEHLVRASCLLSIVATLATSLRQHVRGAACLADT